MSVSHFKDLLVTLLRVWMVAFVPTREKVSNAPVLKATMVTAVKMKVLRRYSPFFLHGNAYTAKNKKLLNTGCHNVVGVTLFNVINNIVRHCYTWLRAHCSILLTARNNTAPTTQLHPVFNNLFTQNFLLCKRYTSERRRNTWFYAGP